MINFFWKKNLASPLRAPQENDAKFRFAMHPQGIRQFHDNCKIAKCQTVAILVPVYAATHPVYHKFQRFSVYLVVPHGQPYQMPWHSQDRSYQPMI